MSIKNLDNLDEAINSIAIGLKPEIWVTTDGTSVYATKGSERVDGVKSGDKFLLKVTTGTWTITAVKGTTVKTSTIDILKATRYNIEISFIPTNLTNTYWQWNNYVSGTTKTYKINFEIRDYSGEYTSLYLPFKLCYKIQGDSIYYYGVKDGEYPFYHGYSTTSKNWGAMLDTGEFGMFTPAPNMQFFEITGGSDVTNSTLISQLVQNATQCDSSWNPL